MTIVQIKDGTTTERLAIDKTDGNIRQNSYPFAGWRIRDDR